MLLILFLLAGAALVFFAIRTDRRWARYALVGIVPGIFIGGIGLGMLVYYGGGDNKSGWEELAAVIAGIFGAFLGAIAGAVCGGVIGLMKDRKRHNA